MRGGLTSGAPIYPLVLASFTGSASAQKGTGTRFSRSPTIVGTGDGELIKGTAGSDVIVAKAGADLIRGRGGNDYVCAGAGADVIGGGGGWLRRLSQPQARTRLRKLSPYATGRCPK